MPHRVALLVFPDFQLPDVAGPIAAFELAGQGGRVYGVRVAAPTPGLVCSSSGVEWPCRPLPRVSDLDTLIDHVRRQPDHRSARSATGTLLAPRP
jgi:transcriptional regulator GlxA family with amidase domain